MISETLADIVAEMREQASRASHFNGDEIRVFADRIDAAAKCLREDEYHRGAEAREKLIYAVLGKPSNAAAMREALLKCRALAETIWQSEGGEDVSAEIAELKDLISAALALPPRQCDVGTPTEQADRHLAMCLKHGGCSTCPRNKKKWSFKDCILEWAQEPYEKGGAECSR